MALVTLLGSGTDGSVWLAIGRVKVGEATITEASAIKAFYRLNNFGRELGSYERLAEFQVENIRGLRVPQLMGFDEDLLIVQLSIVEPPRLLDFGKAYLNSPPDYSPEVLADADEIGRELFENRWPDVQKVLAELADLGIYYHDTKPSNIDFGDDS